MLLPSLTVPVKVLPQNGPDPVCRLTIAAPVAPEKLPLGVLPPRS